MRPDLWDEIAAASNRVLRLSRHAIPCPKCKSPQAELMDAHCEPARWRCRNCKQEFCHEPRTGNGIAA